MVAKEVILNLCLGELGGFEALACSVIKHIQLRRPIKAADSVHYTLFFLKEFAYSTASAKGLLNIEDVCL